MERTLRGQCPEGPCNKERDGFEAKVTPAALTLTLTPTLTLSLTPTLTLTLTPTLTLALTPTPSLG